MKIITLVVMLTLFYCNNNIIGQNITTISGKVVDENEIPLPYVNIYILNTLIGTTSDLDGKFSFSAELSSESILVASIIGYEKRNVILSKNEEAINNLIIVMNCNTVELEEAVVIGSSFGTEKAKGLVISNIDVYTTPGGAADLFQSIKTMPGITNVSESAELYVRGGNPNETVTMIDQASVYHPYTYESSYGGLFSNLNTAAVKSMYFSSGGFSAKYGNVLSGVLDIVTQSQPITQKYTIGISMAAASINAQIPIIQNKLGISIFAQKSYTEPIMWLNGSKKEFSSSPSSQDVTSIINYNYSETGKVKIVGTLASDSEGVVVKRAEYNGVFNGNSSNKLLNFQISDIFNENNFIVSSVSYTLFKNSWKLGALDLDKKDEVFKIRNDIESIISKRLKINSGFEYELRENTFIGNIPYNNYDIRPQSEKLTINSKMQEQRIGIYTEFTFNNILNVKKLHFIGGIRTDYFPKLNLQNYDPRIGLTYKFNENADAKLSWGIFHQTPDMRLFTPSDGNPNLKAMKAEHFLLSFSQIEKDNSFRIELFYKDYSSLPLKNENSNYTNDGFGFAYGADIILKGKLPFNLDGWISYSYLNTKRKWMNYDRLTKSDYDITNGISMIIKYNLSAFWQFGFNFKYSTGRPFTPIIDSEYDTNYNIYKPIYGLENSSNYPDYKRLDFRLTHFNQFIGKYFTVFYVEALNILDINNLFEITYSADYKTKTPVKSYFGRRTIVFGLNIEIS